VGLKGDALPVLTSPMRLRNNDSLTAKSLTARASLEEKKQCIPHETRSRGLFLLFVGVLFNGAVCVKAYAVSLRGFFSEQERKVVWALLFVWFFYAARQRCSSLTLRESSSTRLATRTKESWNYASVLALLSQQCAAKAKVVGRNLFLMLLSLDTVGEKQGCQHHPPTWTFIAEKERASVFSFNDKAKELRAEHSSKYPKDGELCLRRMKPEETLVDARSGTDVQIVRHMWV